MPPSPSSGSTRSPAGGRDSGDGGGGDITLWDLGALAFAVLLYGATFGVIATSLGLTSWAATLMSFTVVAAAAQLATVAVMAAGGGPLAAVGAGLLLNVRFIPLGILASGELSGRRWARGLAAHLIDDFTVAVALVSPPGRRRRAFVASGLTIVIAWTVGTVVGAFAGDHFADPYVLGLDAAFPAGFLLLLVPHLRSRTWIAAAIAAVTAVALGGALPPGLPLLVGAAAGTLAAVAADPIRPRPGTDGQ